MEIKKVVNEWQSKVRMGCSDNDLPQTRADIISSRQFVRANYTIIVLRQCCLSGEHKPIRDGPADTGEDEEGAAARGGKTEFRTCHQILQRCV